MHICVYVGGKSSDYIPKRGFSGTLAPGERFKDNDPIDQLSKSILHPWPSLQEIQMHGRMPVTHPMIPPPVLWFGMNDMYTRNFTDWQMSLHKPDDLVVGGIMMTPRDAMIIARNSSFGVSYDHSQQIPHGGSIFYNGHKIPFYNPDHGPTVSAAEAEPPIPKELLPITERWYDPYDNEDILGTNPYENNDTDSNGTITSLSAKSNTHRRSESEIAEENERRAVFEQLYLNTNEDDRSETDDSMNRILLAEEVEKLRTQRTIMERYAAIKDSQLNKIRDLSAQGTLFVRNFKLILCICECEPYKLISSIHSCFAVLLLLLQMTRMRMSWTNWSLHRSPLFSAAIQVTTHITAVRAAAVVVAVAVRRSHQERKLSSSLLPATMSRPVSEQTHQSTTC